MATAPRAPIERRKSGTLDYPDSYERRMVEWKMQLVRQGAAEMGACQDLQNAQQYIDYLDGKWWMNRPDWRSSFADNYLADQRRESIAALSDIHPAMEISSQVEDYKKQADICLKVIRHLWVREALDLKLNDWIDHAEFGTGFCKVSAYAPGVMEVSAHALGTVIPILMEGHDLQSAQAVLYRVDKTLSHFIRRFGRDRAAGIERYSVGLQQALSADKYARPDDIPEYTWNALSPAMRRRMSLSRAGGPQRGMYGTVAEPFPIIPLLEIYHEDISFNDFGHPVLVKHPDLPVDQHNFHYIVPPGGMLYPRKRLTIFAGDKVMYDGPNPFWDGQYPFVHLQLNPCVWAPGGISKYRDLIPLIKSINRIGAGVDETVMDAVNRTVVSRKGAVEPRMWDAFDPSRPKQKVLLNGTANPATDFKYMDAKNLPPYVEMWLRHLDGRVKTKSGSLDISGLSRKKQAPGGDTIENMRDAMSGPFRLESRYVEQAVKEVAILMVSRIFQFFTLNQRLRLLGPDGQTWEDYDYVAESMVPASAPKEDHWKLFSVDVAQGSMHGSSEFQKKVIAMRLRQGRDLSLRSLYKAINAGFDADEEIQRLKQEAQEMPQPAAKGRTPRQTRTARNGGPI